MKIRICFVLLAVVLATPRVSHAKVLFGQDYTWLSYLRYDYGDGDLSYLDDGNGGSVLVNFNHESDQDIQLGVDYVEADGERLLQDVEIDILTFKADIVHTFSETDTVKPFINIGLRVQDRDVTGPATGSDDTDVGLGLGIGVELELAPMLMAKISANHDNVGDEANYFTAMLGCWFSDDLLGTIGIGREFDGDSTYLQAGVVFAY
ncbi:MAG: outer membrane beta-barrel protein [Candidatus Zixiibacteriota bacterium]|nr:MAG: outer membrane beta-barrel protein [candidate division Zixibacteria bacterium]